MNEGSPIRLTRARFDAVIFDLDGVVTRTARQHARAWKRMFDEFLARRSRREGRDFVPFDIDADYRQFVDGKPRYDGVLGFLRSRGIELPWGDPRDPPTAVTVCGLGNRKNELFGEVLDREGAEVFEDAIDLVRVDGEWKIGNSSSFTLDRGAPIPMTYCAWLGVIASILSTVA